MLNLQTDLVGECCGIGVLYNLTPYPTWEEREKNMPPALVTVEAINTAIEDHEDENNPRAIWVANITAEQKQERKALAAAGFTVLGKFNNPNSGNTVIIMFRGPLKLAHKLAPKRKRASLKRKAGARE
jgi:hypothetical protein